MTSEQSPKERFFAAVPKPKVSTVELEGQTVTIREMTIGERLAFEAAVAGKTNGETLLAAVVASVVDDDGNLVFTPADLPRLKQLPPNSIMPVARAVLKLNALTDDDIKELAKN